MSQYIKDELNCLQFELLPNEEDYVLYSTTPDHKEMGGALKRAYTKALKEKVSSLSRDQVREYLQNGSLTLEGVEIKGGWITVAKSFTDKVKAQPELGVDSNLDAAVMLDLKIDEELRQMGLAREIVNKVQKLRKAAGLNIEDQVEVFYELHST